jgi:hypothetical protein
MIVLFHENVLLLSTYKFIVIPIKYRNFGVFVYDSAEKQMLNTIDYEVLSTCDITLSAKNISWQVSGE